MEYIKTNKDLLMKYLYIIISNILIVILCNFYFKNSEYKDIFIMFIAIIFDMIIYYYKGIKSFKILLDSLVNFIIGLILMFFYKDIISFGIVLFSLFFSNNLVFIRSRLKEKFWKNTLEYILVFIINIIIIFINMCLYSILYM